MATGALLHEVQSGPATVIGTPVPAPVWGLGSNSNYIFCNNCQPITDLTITINVTQDIVCQSASGPTTGFGFQLNAYSPMAETSAWQQYVIALFESELIGAVDNWPQSGPNIINDFFNLAGLPSARIPAGYQLRIALKNDASGIVTGASYAVGQHASAGGGWGGAVPLGGSAVQMAVGQNLDGRLELFYVGTDSKLYHTWQVTPGGSWSGQVQFAGDSARQVTVARNRDGRLEIFYVGTNNDLYHNWQTAAGQGWAGENHFAGDSAKQIAVASNADGRLEIFYVGTNNDLYHNWQTAAGGGWAGENHFAGDSAKQIAVASNADGRLEIFYVGTNNDLYHNWQVSPGGSWSGETRFATNSADQVAVGRNLDGRLEIFYVGTDQALYHNWQVAPGSGWSGETRFAQNSALQVAVGQNADGRLEIFYVGTDHMLYHNWQVSPGSGWAGETGLNEQVSYVEVGREADGRLDVFYAGNELADVSVDLTSLSGVSAAELSPIIAFELNLVGPVNGESAVLSSGAGTITYEASSPLTVLDLEPVCAESGYITAETANSTYGTLTSGPSKIFRQTFQVSTAAPTIRKQGKPRPTFIVPDRWARS